MNKPDIKGGIDIAMTSPDYSTESNPVHHYIANHWI